MLFTNTIFGGRMKIFVISNMYPSKKYPHYGTFVKHTVSLMRENGIDVDVESIQKVDKKWQKIIIYFSFYLRSIIKLMFSDYDYVYVHYVSHSSLPVLFVSKIKKMSVIANVHGNDIVPETDNDKKYLNYSKRILDMSFKVVCPSEYFKKILSSEYKVNEKKIVVYPSGGVDTNLFRKIDRGEALKELNLSKNKVYIGYVSRLEKNKGYDIFLKACYELHKNDKNMNFIVVGDGEEVDKYEELVDRYHLREYIVKYNLLSQEKLVYLFNAMDVFVFPTYRKSESLGLVGLEAMACETVTVLPNRYGPTSYSQNGVNSYVFESQNSDELSKTIEKALNSNNDILCKNAREKAKEYDSHITDGLLIDIFKS